MAGGSVTGSRTRIRLTAMAAVAATLVTGLTIRGVSDGVVAKYAGDALYTVLLYGSCVVAVPRIRPLAAGLTACGVSWAIEFFQLTPIPAELSQRSVLARLVLGSTFNAPDLLWYAVGAAVALLVHAVALRGAGKAARRPAGRRPVGEEADRPPRR